MASWSTLRGVAKAALEAVQFGGGGGLLGLIIASTAVFSAVREPPPSLHKSAYSLLLSAVFFAGMAEVITAVVVSTYGCPPPTCLRGYDWRKLTRYACLLAAAVSLSVT